MSTISHAQAFNLLPVGQLDGGRLTQAAFGRMALNFTSILTYVGLTLGFIGGTMSLPFGIFIILAQRAPVSYIKDEVTPVDTSREVATAVLVLIGLLILVPLSPDSPELLDSMQAGIQAELMQAAPVDPGAALSV
jgi:membrane-associated protease RseP (regulator of RpoE activity)